MEKWPQVAVAVVRVRVHVGLAQVVGVAAVDGGNGGVEVVRKSKERATKLWVDVHGRWSEPVLSQLLRIEEWLAAAFSFRFQILRKTN